MRPAMLVAFLLLLFLLVATAQGIRLEGESLGAFQKELQEENISIIGGGGSERGTTPCRKDGQCSGTRSRRLLMNAKAAPKSTRSEVEEAGGSHRVRPEEGAAGPPVKPAVSGHKKSAPETYPDLMDIEGMDYSPAARKPPIHN